MFSNLAKTKLDDKGRLAVPSRQRGRLDDESGRVVLTVAPLDRCLLLFPYYEWKQISEQVAAMPNMRESVRLMQRRLLGHASEMTLDGAGRILIDKVLRDAADLDKEVALVWQGNKFEIWSAEVWDAAAGQPLQLSEEELQEFAMVRV